MKLTQLTTCLLDVDGTLIDSNDAHAESWVEVLRAAGYDVSFERVRPLIGMGGDKLLPELIDVEHDSEEGERLSKRRGKLFLEEYLPELRPFPRVRDLLERMRDDGFALVVASSAQEDELRALVKAAGVADLLEEKTSSSDAESSKPDPDIVQAAIARTDATPEECVMLGDTPYDVAASLRAGVEIVALRCGGWPDEDLRGAIEIYDDPADLLARYEESVFGRAARTRAARGDVSTIDR